MNTLVTGACGQLGMELRLATENSPNRFIFTDIVGAVSSGNVGNVEYLDITSPEAVMQAVETHKPEVIVNCAAYTNVEEAEEERAEAYRVNCMAVENLALAASFGGATLLHISTDYVFDGRIRRPYKEDDLPEPLNVYGETKLAGEEAVVASGCRHMIFRTSWLYSPFGNNFVKTMLRALREGSEVKVIDDQIGTPTYAADLATLLCRIIDGGLYGRTGTYNYSNGGECSRYEFASAIAELVGFGNIKPCKTNDYPSKAVRPEYSVLDKTKVRKAFGAEIPLWRDSLAKCVARLEQMQL